jgi:hypothetical protein
MRTGIRSSALRTQWSLTLAFLLLAIAGSTTFVAAKASDTPSSSTRADLAVFNKVSLGEGFVETLYEADSGNHPEVVAVRITGAGTPVFRGAGLRGIAARHAPSQSTIPSSPS